jgi:hypothetical protein
MKAFLLAVISISILYLNQGCNNVHNQNEHKFLSVKNELKSNDSIGNIIELEIYDKVGPGVESMMQYINNLVNNSTGSKLTSAQLGQVLNHFRANDPEIDKIINEGKNYPDQTKAKQIWDQIYSEYSKGDKDQFIKNVTDYGDIYHLNWFLKEWNKSHLGSEVVQAYNRDPSVCNLEIYRKRHETMEKMRSENAGKIQVKLKENLDFKTKKLNEEGFNISSNQVKNALNIIMNEYVAKGYNSTKMREDAEKIDKLIEGKLGVKLKTSLINELFEK